MTQDDKPVIASVYPGFNMLMDKTTIPTKDWKDELTKLEKKRTSLHEYILMKLEEHDYHAVQDAGSDLRELDARCKAIREWLDGK